MSESLSTVNGDTEESFRTLQPINFLFNPIAELLFLVMNLNYMNESALEASKRDASLCALFFDLTGHDLCGICFHFFYQPLLFLVSIEKPQL